MKKTITLVIIGSAIIFAASCQKEELPQLSSQSILPCPNEKQHPNVGIVKGPELSLDKKAIVNVVACRACHVVTFAF